MEEGGQIKNVDITNHEIKKKLKTLSIILLIIDLNKEEKELIKERFPETSSFISLLTSRIG